MSKKGYAMQANTIWKIFIYIKFWHQKWYKFLGQKWMGAVHAFVYPFSFIRHIWSICLCIRNHFFRFHFSGIFPTFMLIFKKYFHRIYHHFTGKFNRDILIIDIIHLSLNIWFGHSFIFHPFWYILWIRTRKKTFIFI